MQKGGVLFNDSADKAARFIWLCDAFEIPLLFLADVPGFMIGTDVERRGIIRHGAKMISAVAEATVPKISVIVRKAYGAGLYAMAGPAYDPDVTIALPSAQIAVMGPAPAVNAVFYNKLAELPAEQRDQRRKELEAEHRDDGDVVKAPEGFQGYVQDQKAGSPLRFDFKIDAVKYHGPGTYGPREGNALLGTVYMAGQLTWSAESGTFTVDPGEKGGSLRMHLTS